MKAVAVLLLLGVAGAMAQADAAGSLKETLLAEGKLADLVAAIEKVPGFIDQLDGFSGTVLAPNREAFAKLMAAASAAGFVDIPEDVLEQVLSYHILPNTLLRKQDITNGMTVATALDGKDLTVNINEAQNVSFVGVGSSANAVSYKPVGGAVLYIIDNVLLPMSLGVGPAAPAPAPAGFGSILEAIEALNMTALATALDITGLDAALGSDFNGTVFVPSPEILAEAATPELLDNEELVKSILLMHVSPDHIDAADIVDGMTIPTLAGTDLVATIKDGKVFINGYEVETADVHAGDAEIHVIKGVIMPEMGAPDAIPVGGAASTLASAAVVAASVLAAVLLA